MRLQVTKKTVNRGSYGQVVCDGVEFDGEAPRRYYMGRLRGSDRAAQRDMGRVLVHGLS